MYLEVVPNRRLVKTWAYDGPNVRDETPSVLTIDFRELRPGVTELTLTHAQLGDDKTSEGVGAGWALCLDQLAGLFNRTFRIEETRNLQRRDFMRDLMKYGTGTAGLTLMALCINAQQENQQKRLTNGEKRLTTMKIKLTSVMVNDQDKALKFYTEVLGFVKKTEVPMGPAKWLTVVSPEEPDGTQLLLEPMGFQPAKTFQKALFEAGIPLTSFAVEDIQKEYERMQKLGVVFRTKPTKTGPVTIAVFEDTCGNLIQIAQA
jgi:catechol 2,3-dioxygenase-like lactoylglutathione lyase family enzyme